ncbi:MAG: hypothetical protein JNJ61_23155, partial [Anaerolineae bacterium]|nr:hypothetical protein [Anaerolineae bacterium]
MTEPNRPLSTLRSNQVMLEAGYWGERQKANRLSTIPAIYHQLERTHRTAAWHLHGDADPRHDHHIVHR